MKAFVLFLTIAAAVAFGWFAYPDIAKSLGMSTQKGGLDATTPEVADTGIPKPPGRDMATRQQESTTIKMQKEPVKETVASGDSSSPSMSINTQIEVPKIEPPRMDNAITTSAAAPSNAPDASGFQTIEVLTSNWTSIPTGAFKNPKQITVKKPVKISSGEVEVTIKPMQAIYAVGAQGTNIIVSPTVGSPLKGQVALEDTNVKELLTTLYDQWKIKRVAQIKAEEDYAVNKANNALRQKLEQDANAIKDAGPKPEKNSAGQYGLLIDSMRAKQVTEISLNNINSWGEPTMQQIKGETVWTVEVDFEADTILGKFPSKAMAIVKAGKVKKWQYVGSGEDVP